MHNYYAYLLLAVSILTTVKIFQFLYSPLHKRAIRAVQKGKSNRS